MPGVESRGGRERVGTVARLVTSRVARWWWRNSSDSRSSQSVLLLLALLHLLGGGHDPHGEHVGVAGEGPGPGECQLWRHRHQARPALLGGNVASARYCSVTS